MKMSIEDQYSRIYLLKNQMIGVIHLGSKWRDLCQAYHTNSDFEISTIIYLTHIISKLIL